MSVFSELFGLILIGMIVVPWGLWIEGRHHVHRDDRG